MRRFLRENGLSLVLFFVFFLPFLIGQSLAGHRENNLDLEAHGRAPQTLRQYLGSPHFWEATSENWESEFLQMGAYVFLTAFLFQKGSSESKKIDEPNEVDRDPRVSQRKKDVPSPVRLGGWRLTLYQNSLTLAFLLLFLTSLSIHAVSGRLEYNEDRAAHAQSGVSLGAFIVSSRFWFESFQNWQSEFLAMWAMVVFSIWLRQKGSPESKPVDSPHGETGGG